MSTNGTVPAQAAHGNFNAGQNEPSLGDLSSISSKFAQLKAQYNDDSTEEDNVPAPGDSVGDDDDVPNPADGDGNAEDNYEGDGPDEDNASEEDDANLPTDDDIDWEYKVPVKIDGKVMHLSLEELKKGYATAQSLSAKGRELGDERKKLDIERNEKLQEVVQLGSALHEKFDREEKAWATEYNRIKTAMDKAIEDGDGYEAKELRSKLTQAQSAYWEVRKSREELTENVGKHVQAAAEAQHQQQLAYFNDNIGKFIPDFTPEMAGSIRNFAIEAGLPEEALSQIYDPAIVKFINDFRVLKEKTAKGAAKRKEAPNRTVPSKKGIPLKSQKERVSADLRGKVLLGEGDTRDQLDFLKGISSIGSKLGI